MKPFRYRIIVEWSDQDVAFVATVPALPGCAAHGDTPERAAREARIAGEGVLASLRDHGDPVPLEDACADFSGQLRLRIPSTLHATLARLAAADGVSLNHELVTLLAQGCGSKHMPKSRKRTRAPASSKPRLHAA